MDGEHTTPLMQRDIGEAGTFSIVPHPSLSGAPSLALLLPFLVQALGHDPLWVFVEFLHSPIPGKRLGSNYQQTKINASEFNVQYNAQQSIIQ